MKAFLLAAGHGTRLRPLTDCVPKCLLPIRGKPMLEIWLERCFRFGVSEVLVNLHSHSRMVQDFIGNTPFSARVQITEEPVLLGSAGTVLANREWLGRDEMFWILYADVLTSVNLDRFRQFHEAHKPAATLGITEVPDPSRCGVVTVNAKGVITSFVEKPAVPTSNLAFAGVMIGTQEFLAAVPDRRPADIGFDVLFTLEGRMMAYPISEYLQDIGTMANYEAAQTFWLGEP